MICPCGAEYDEDSYDYLRHRGCRLSQHYASKKLEGGLLMVDVSKPKDDVADAWDVTEEAINRNKQPRFNWKALLGESVDSYVFRNCVSLSPDDMIAKIMKEHPYLKPEAVRRLRINVCSSFVRARKRRG